MINDNINPEVVPKQTELSETVENYLKRILWLSQTNEKVRISDIARLMGRERSSATETIQRLKAEGYVNYEKYGSVSLTTKGLEIAESINNTYTLFANLLIQIGIPEDIALEDACSMEHGISEKTTSQVEKFLEFVKENETIRQELEKLNKK